MQRLAVTPRPNWQQILEAQGMNFHTEEGEHYWDESACYAFSPREVERIEAASYALNKMCLAAVGHAIENRLWHEFDIAPRLHDWIAQSWERDGRTIYGRFDFAFGGEEWLDGQPKLLEYNADIPTALLEAAVAQWFWLQDWAHTSEAQALLSPSSTWDQFNTLHERLVEVWRHFTGRTVYFTGLADSLEDFTTVSYLRETARQAGVEAPWIRIERIGWSARRGAFVDEREKPIGRAFKLYPWEWLVAEEFGQHLPHASTRWLEAPWKMLLSNKALLPLLWRLFPGSPYLLRAEHAPWSGDHVSKPLLSREGSNVSIRKGGQVLAQTSGPYTGRVIYQQYVPLRNFGAGHPIIGSWMVNSWACGVGIREDAGVITGNDSRFVPHVFAAPRDAAST